ncbi:hypothetical protein DPMN_125764 [Dreissena polymorpha]|uniref:Sulfhydryl oxidase Trx-like domain-containing protein n=1 Tax=Dreissena polymorpha TaxID=45954 RepID=A0A9D4JV06_DREPO|nr:hypothetical protein DPMN_125764 [Dreissena polymorpha]
MTQMLCLWSLPFLSVLSAIVYAFQVILDTLKYRPLLVRRMLHGAVEKFGVTTIPALFLINRDGTFTNLAKYKLKNLHRFQSPLWERGLGPLDWENLVVLAKIGTLVLLFFFC